MKDVNQTVDPGLDASTVRVETAAALRRIVGREDFADLIDRHLEVAQPADRPRDIELLGAVAPVASEPVDIRGSEQVQLVVVAQRPDRQARETSEPADGQELRPGQLRAL